MRKLRCLKSRHEMTLKNPEMQEKKLIRISNFFVTHKILPTLVIAEDSLNSRGVRLSRKGSALLSKDFENFISSPY